MSGSAAVESFADFEKRRWGETAELYDRLYTPLTDQTIEELLDSGGVDASKSCLDLACGPGTLAARAAARGARVVGIDFAPEMIEQARARHAATPIEFRIGDAEALDLASDCMDAVLMNFAMMHVARPERVASEAARVLRADGRFCFTLWAPPERSAAMKLIADAMSRASASVEMPAGEPFHRYCDFEESRRMLSGAGFDADTVALQDVAVTWHLPHVDALFDLFASATTRSALVLARQPEATRSTIRAAFATGVAAWPAAFGEYAVPHAAILVSASKRSA
jgi:ubiquinone/menaquinone biosynthesis C-methylase UbiE